MIGASRSIGSGLSGTNLLCFETAAALGIGRNTVLRDWNFARAWLRRELSGERTAKSEPREAN